MDVHGNWNTEILHINPRTSENREIMNNHCSVPTLDLKIFTEKGDKGDGKTPPTNFTCRHWQVIPYTFTLSHTELDPQISQKKHDRDNTPATIQANTTSTHRQTDENQMHRIPQYHLTTRFKIPITYYQSLNTPQNGRYSKPSFSTRRPQTHTMVLPTA